MLTVFALLSTVVVSSAQPTDYLRNGDFSVVEKGVPARWAFLAGIQSLRVDEAEKPEGAARSLRIDLRAASRSEGQLVQRVDGLKPGKTYLLESSLRSTVNRIGYLQVKLYKDGKELKRLSPGEFSTTQWRRVQFYFGTEDADRVEVLLRWKQKAELVGQSVWFAEVTLTDPGPPRLLEGTAVTTFESLGVRIGYAGGLSPKTRCKLRFRKAGDRTWRAAMDCWEVREDREFRGSLLGLTPATEYEVECQLYEGDEVLSSARLTGRTWTEDVAVGQVRELPVRSAEPLVIRNQGKPEAWIVYRPAAGQEAMIDGGVAAEQAVLFDQAAYVLLENVRVLGGRRDGIEIRNSHHVRVRHCDVSGWGEAGTRREGRKDGLYFSASGKPINYNAGVRISSGSSQVVVEGNFFHSPRGSANSWQYGHPKGPQGILLHSTGGNNVVRFNEVIGSETHWWNDALESISNREVNGGPYRDTDLYGNVLAFSNDDGTELDGGQINVRYWHNWIDKALCGISHAPNRSGPCYVFRNLIAGLGEERGAAGSAFKMGGGARWSTGMNVIVHNTIYGPGGGLRSVGFGDDKDRGGYLAFSRNNLFAGPGGSDITNISTDRRNDFDYDLTSRGGVKLGPGQEAHAVTDTPRFVAAELADFRLAAGSPGIDQGVRLPGINDHYAGAAPDMGALESGTGEGALFPPRPGGLSALPLRQTLAARLGSAAEAATVTLLAPPTVGTKWTAHPNCDWLQCEPPSGGTGADVQTVRVTLRAGDRELRLHRGAVTFRTDLGFCRTVMVEVKVYPAKPFAKRLEAEAGERSGSFRVVQDASASGGAYVDTPGDAGEGSGTVKLAFDVPESGVYYLAARCLAPDPDAGLHDSFFAAMDGAAPRIWDLRGYPTSWKWSLVNARETENPCRFELSTGRHTFTILPRERLARVDCLVVLNGPYLEDALRALP